MFCFCFCSVPVRVHVRACACAWVCMCVRVHVRACAVQTASSATALWKTNSVSVDGASRQRSSSDPPAIHPPLPPLRVTSTSTFSPFSFLASGLLDLDGWGVLLAATGGKLRSRMPTGRGCQEPSPVCPPHHHPRQPLQPPSPAADSCLSRIPPGGAHTLSSSVFPST